MSHRVKGALLWGFALIAAAGQLQAACNANLDGYHANWSDQTWANGSSSGVVTSKASDTTRADQTVSVNINGSTDRFFSDFPKISNTLIGDHGSGEQALNIAADFADNTSSLETLITFPSPVEGLTFEILDIDERLIVNGENGGFRDSIKITATGPSGSVAPVLSVASPSNVSINGGLPANWALGEQGQVANGSNLATLYVSFSAPVTRVTIDYSNSISPPSPDPDPQGIGIYDLSYCSHRPRASISVTKTQKLHSQLPVNCDQIPGLPDDDGVFAVPGVCVEYKITAENLGDGTATGMDLTDRLNANLLYLAADYTGFSNGGEEFGITAPPPMTDCSGGACVIQLEDAQLAPGQTGVIVIRALVK